ncbi:unnamed protein product [Pylaiella littoralis]
MSSTVDSDRDERFKHLLQPIRDLAQNWDVDIATSLEDYLEDLEEITITLDGGASKVNFAEAALLIQGSTCVYSRKVEHVYQLVLQTIDFLTQQKQQKDANASKGNSGDDDIAGEEDAAFLQLDDILEGKNIDIEGPAGRARNRRRSSIAPMHSHGYGDDRGGGGLSGGGDVQDITRPPMFLMEQDYGNSFKMSTCAPQQQCGTLLIEGSGLQDSSGGSFSLVAPFNGGTGGTARACDFWRGLGREGRGDGGGGGGASLEASADTERWTGGTDNGNGNDDESDGGSGDFGADYGGPEDELDEPRGDVAADGPHTPVTSTSGGRELRPRAPKEAPKADHAPSDPWAALDPHDPGTLQARPIRKGRTYKLPPQLRKRRGSKKKQEAVEGGLCGEVQQDFGGSWVGHDGRLTLSVPLLGLAYPEFQYVANRERQRKAAQTRLARRQARVFMGREEFFPQSIPSNAAIGGGAMAADDVGAYDGYGSDGSYGSGGGGEGGGFGDFGNESDDDDGSCSGGYNDDAQRHGRGKGGGNVGVGPISLEDAFRNKPQTYEDLCRTHIEAFMRGTEKYAHETQLSKRVGAWQEKLEPLMERRAPSRRQKRQTFDIHAYGQSVLSRVASALTSEQRAKATTAVKGAEAKETTNNSAAASSEEGAKGAEPDLPLVDFGVVVAGKEHFDVCRLFLASLQLANNGNVRLFHGDNAAEQATTPFQLELLSMQNSDNMSGCFAPAGSGLENAPENGAKTGAKNGAQNSAGSKAKVKSSGRSGGRGGVVGTKEKPRV